MTTETSDTAPHDRVAQPEKTWPNIWAAFGLFFIQALKLASWLPRPPELKTVFQLFDGNFGLALWALPVGLLRIIPVVGYAATQLSLSCLNLICVGIMSRNHRHIKAPNIQLSNTSGDIE